MAAQRHLGDTASQTIDTAKKATIDTVKKGSVKK
jgi:hypothetical protein